MIAEIQQLSNQLFDEIVTLRRQIHQNPELAFEEQETMQLVSNYLSKQQIEHQKEIAKTGVVGIIKGKNPDKKTIALRADMDALPILEENQVAYKSRNEGKMHACGHDVHTACLLGAANILNQLKDEFEGSIKLIFQPSEEKNPGGAKYMIAEGVLENPSVSTIFGQHVLPELESGKVGFIKGMAMASADEIYVSIQGKGGHASAPHKLIDPVIAAAQVLVALQTVSSRFSTPFSPVVLSFGKIIANGATNVIPDKVELIGTFRCMDEELRFKCHEQIKNICEQTAASFGAKADVNIDVGYPFLVNDPSTTENAISFAKEFLGEENVVSIEPRMSSEDFAYYSQKIPATFYRLGVANESKGIVHPIHTSLFNVEEESLKTGMGLMAYIALRQLQL